MEAFVRKSGDDATWEGLAPELRRRMQGNGLLFAEVEFAPFVAYQADEEQLARISCPVVVLAGTQSPAFRRPICDWLAARLGCPVVTLPGGHMPYLDRPRETAETLRPLLHERAGIL